MRTKKELIKKLKKIGEDKIRQGLLFKELAYSIESRKDEKTMKEWLTFCRDVLKLDEVKE